LLCNQRHGRYTVEVQSSLRGELQKSLGSALTRQFAPLSFPPMFTNSTKMCCLMCAHAGGLRSDMVG
jgi:hypothetical protein